MIETLFPSKYELVPVALHTVRKNMFIKDSFIRHFTGWKICLGKDHGGVENKQALKDEQLTEKPNAN